MQRLRTRVLVVGGGPVGTTLAMDLAWRGIDVLVLEQRRRDEAAEREVQSCRGAIDGGVPPARRGAGGARRRAAGTIFRTTFRSARRSSGTEFARIPIPCRRDRYTATEGPDTWWPTPEPPHRINQIFLEPVLVDYAMAMPGLRFLHRVKVLGFTQSADGVVTEAEDLDSGERLLIDSDYLIGCDGGHSEIRRQIGARLTGDAVVQRTQSTYFRAPSLLGMMQARPAWSNQSMNPRRSANIFAIDGRETWLLHCYLRPDEPDFESVDRDRCFRLVVGRGGGFRL